jgi:hypothetical protein
MNRRLRRRHLRTWLVLGPLILLGLTAALLARHAPATASSPPAGTEDRP